MVRSLKEIQNMNEKAHARAEDDAYDLAVEIADEVIDQYCPEDIGMFELTNTIYSVLLGRL